MKKITLNQSGTFKHLWLPGVHAEIPSDAIEVSDKQFLDLSQNITTKAWDHNRNTVVDYEKPFDFESQALAKKQQIRAAFEGSALLPVEHAGITYNGGFMTALRIDGVRRVAEAKGEDVITFHDLSNQPRQLSLAEATGATIAISDDYKIKFTRKQELINAVDALDPATATQADLDSIPFI